ncbi:hypothetical protein CON66_27210 [Bacillus cereus]|uniref:SIR2 family protein n=1 Tax=Bacillus cereus TaxID=1396 RepID=UPI000BEE5B92|nr:SIR2 family protein [Bacillus cereus]PEA92923.1 hypothetical protein CON66_27210 [Bacillus cereus]PED37392.1 hypothetical protein CON24_14360 [Bacillus cereus]
MDSRLTMALSMQSNKGIYALFLGSGVSYSARIKTGWGIIQDICDHIRTLQPETLKEGESSVDWYSRICKKEPRYDDLLEIVAPTSAERQGFLEKYFVPTEQEREDGMKTPTQAHRSIAQLVKKGYIKVILTTNFDQLMEQALQGEGVTYQVVHDESSIAGMRPLLHSDCTVIKINGDYKDNRFRNISEELSSYSPNLEELLKDIFDKFGLIISGWSGEWDVAIKDIMKSIVSRRYSWYWHSYSNQLTTGAQELVTFRDAQVILNNEGADGFFSQLLNNVEAIEKHLTVNTFTVETIIAQAKNLLGKNKLIELHDLIMSETENVMKNIREFPLDNQIGSLENLHNSIKELMSKSAKLCALLTTVCYYNEYYRVTEFVIDTLSRLTCMPPSNDGTFYPLNEKLRRIPSIVATYSVGIALFKRNAFGELEEMLTKPHIYDEYYSERDSKYLEYVNPYRIYSDLKDYGDNRFVPMSEMIFEQLGDITRHILPTDREYMEYFELFELIFSLKSTQYQFGGSYGRFVYHYNRSYFKNFLMDGARKKEDWAVLKLFNNDSSLFKSSLELIQKPRDGWFGFNLAQYYQVD